VTKENVYDRVCSLHTVNQYFFVILIFQQINFVKKTAQAMTTKNKTMIKSINQLSFSDCQEGFIG
jgi:hypothetical protein